MDITLDYYNENAEKFAQNTVDVEFSDTQNKFLSYIPENSYILDFGCGSGRDTKYFMQRGYMVEAIDGSEELCKIASEYAGCKVRHMLFQELNENEKYDGIWACSSILHLDKIQLIDVLKKLVDALKKDGIIYTSFKYGEFEGLRNGRYFTDFTLENFTKYIKQIDVIYIEEYWITGDVRQNRGEEKWLNMILRKK